MAGGRGEGGDVATPLLDGAAADGPPAEPPPVWTDELRGAGPGVAGRGGRRPLRDPAPAVCGGGCNDSVRQMFRQSVSGYDDSNSSVTEVNRSCAEGALLILV